MDLIRSRLRIIATGDQGRGLQAAQNFKEGDIIESAPVLVIPIPNYIELKTNEHLKCIWARTFTWVPDDNKYRTVGAIVHGYMTMCNHSDTPNAQLNKVYDNEMMELKATMDISEGDMITIKYNNTNLINIKDWYDGKSAN